MPSWLDTAAGRSAWVGDREAAEPGEDWSEVLDEDDENWADGDDEPAPDEDEWAEAPRRRFTMLPPAAIGLIGVGVIACVIAGFTLLRGTEPAVPLVDLPSSAGPTAVAAPGASGAPETEIVVSVAGLVHKPGLIRLPPGARVAEALDRAGGGRPNADLLSLNLAQPLNDGDQVLVGTSDEGAGSLRSAVVGSSGGPGGESGGGGAAPGATAAAGGKVNLNTATAAELDTLPGVGPVTAQAIIAWRESHGAFSSVEQLAEVDGIGPARLAKLRDAVTVGG